MAINLKRFIKEPVDEHYDLFECKRRDSSNGAHIGATFKTNGTMMLTMTSYGESVEEHYGDFDIECFRHFDKKSLAKLKLLLEKKGNLGFCNQLKKRFFVEYSFSALDKFCNDNEVKFSSAIY